MVQIWCLKGGVQSSGDVDHNDINDPLQKRRKTRLCAPSLKMMSHLRHFESSDCLLRHLARESEKCQRDGYRQLHSCGRCLNGYLEFFTKEGPQKRIFQQFCRESCVPFQSASLEGSTISTVGIFISRIVPKAYYLAL